MRRFHHNRGGIGLLQRTKDFFFPPPVSDLAALEEFVGSEAAYLAQKTVIGYCRVKTMLDYDKLMSEPAFRDGQEACRWEAYASTLGDTLIVVEGYLRPTDPAMRPRVAAALARLYPALLDRHLPPHRTTWDDAKTAFAERFALTCQAAPAAPDLVIEGSARLIHDQVPIHPRLKREDLEVILGDLRLHMLALHAMVLKRFSIEALVAALTR